MGKAIRNYLIILGLLVVIMAMTVFSSQKKSWAKSYDVAQKDPYGLYILSEEIDAFFDKKVIKTPFTPYEYYKKDSFKGENNYIFTQNIDRTSLRKILTNVKEGSNAFFIQENRYSSLDTLEIEREIASKYYYIEEVYLQLATESFDEKIEIPQNISLTEAVYFEKFKEGTKALGYIYSDGQKYINFIEIPYGKGKIYIHSAPIFFTNYYLKDFPEVRKYAFAALSYLPRDKQTIWFDENFRDNGRDLGDLSFIMSQSSLKIAWRLLLAGIILYLFFRGKREQRIILVIKKPENTTIEFAQSISSLYYQEGDPSDLVQKKITYFLDNVRNRYYMDTQQIDEKFAERLYNKSGKDKELVGNIVNSIITFERTKKADDKVLTNLDKWIEKFWN